MKTKFLILYIFITLFIIGCSNDQTRIFTSDDIEKIKIKLVEKQEMEDGISYTINLVNGSDYVIKQNNVYLYYPIKTDTGSKGNEFKVEARGNKLNIEPNEEVTLTIFTPFVGMSNQELLIEKPTIRINGYIEEVDNSHSFNKVGGFEFFQ
ncbi:hypothetical protein [Bacillus sp. AK128]